MIQNTTGADIKIFPNGDPREVDQAIHNAIAKRAFQIFENRGRTAGREQQDWVFAESEVVRPLWCGVLDTEDGVEVSVDLGPFDLRMGIEIVTEPSRVIISGVERSSNGHNRSTSKRGLPSQIFGIVQLPAKVDATKIKSDLKGHLLQIRVSKVTEQSLPTADRSNRRQRECLSLRPPMRVECRPTRASSRLDVSK